MAASYEIVETRSKQMSYTATSADKITCSATRTYDVEVTGVEGKHIDMIDVLAADGIPIPNKSAYVHEDGTSMVPFVLCRNVTATQNPKRLSRWQVVSKWGGVYEGGNPTFVTANAVGDITPKVTSKLGEIERVLYADKPAAGEDPKQIISPAGTWYENPTMEKIPTLELTIEQYETSITYAEMLRRKFKCNSGVYRNTAPYTWLIVDVQATEVEVWLAGGPVTAALVKHEIHYNPRTKKDGTLDVAIGWRDSRTLIDTHYLEPVFEPEIGIERREFKDSALGLQNMGFIDTDGTKRAKAFEKEPPLSVEFRPYEVTNFDNFLQV